MSRGFWFLACVLASALLAPAAQAALPSAQPPSNKALATAGLKVSWPLKAQTTTVAPGRRLVVKLTATSRRAAAARIGLVRVDARGRSIRVVSEKRARHGTLQFVVPARAGASYQLRLVVAGKSYRSWLRTAAVLAPAPASVAPAPVAPAPVVVDGGLTAAPCAGFDGPLSLSVEPAAAKPGDNIRLSLSNSGPTCGGYGAGWGFQQQQENGTWIDRGPEASVPSVLIGVFAGTVASETISVPSGLTPGAYRIVKATGPSGYATTPFTVLTREEYAIPGAG